MNILGLFLFSYFIFIFSALHILPAVFERISSSLSLHNVGQNMLPKVAFTDRNQNNFSHHAIASRVGF